MRLYPIPLLLAATVACQSTEPTVSTQQPAGPAVVPSTVPVELSAPTQDAPLDAQDARDLVNRTREAQDSLADDYMARAQAELDRADLHAALASASNAVDLAPS